VGACLATVGVGSLWALPELPISHAVPLGIAASVAGQVGDLVESMLKRTFGVKDSGRLLPGHGGMLDRIDALLFVAPVAYYYVVLIA
jgi:phosphatidate cytidylyltransferase